VKSRLTVNRVLCSQLILSLVTGPLVARASMADPSVVMLLNAARASTASDADSALAMAREKISHENISQESIDTILSSLTSAAAEKKANLLVPSKVPPKNNHLGTTTVTVDTAIGGDDASLIELQKLLQENPALRQTMLDISKARLQKDSMDIVQALQTANNTSVQTVTTQLAAVDNPGAPNFLIGWLKAAGLFNDIPSSNDNLRSHYPNLTNDQLADKVIGDTMKCTAAVTAGKKLASLARNQSFGRWIERAGIGIDVLGSFACNSRMILRMIDLYGVNLSENDQEITILLLWNVSKLSLYMGANAAGPGMPPGIQKVAGSIGTKIGQMAVDSSDRFRGALLKGILRTPALGPFLAKNGLGRMQLAEPLIVAPPIGIMPVPIPSNPTGVLPPIGIQPVTPVTPVTPVITQPPSVLPPDAKVTTEEPADQKPRKVSIAFFAANLLEGAVSVGWSLAETKAAGELAKWAMKNAMVSERERANQSLMNYLTSSEGEGFVKLMILSLTSDGSIPKAVDVDKTSDKRIKFIANIVRSMGACSPAEKKRWLAVKAGTLKVDADKARFANVAYACDKNFNLNRYSRMRKELLTFNEIPQSSIARLRTASRVNRLGMAEILVQMPYVSGDRSPEDVEMFTVVTTKILGLTQQSDHEYFMRIDGVIRKGRGMIEDDKTPTGFKIDTFEPINPYDMTLGYTRFLNIAPPPAPAVVPTTPTPGVPTPGIPTPGIPTPVTPGVPPNPPVIGLPPVGLPPGGIKSAIPI
jgi:hypothetical protein